MYLDDLKLINEFYIKKYNEPQFNEPALKDKINSFIKESQMALQYTPDDEYIELLRLTNGFEALDVYFYEVENFIPFTLDSQKAINSKDIIVFGYSGSILMYTYNMKNKTYHMANTCDLFENIETFKTFGELVKASLKIELEHIYRR